MEELYPELQHDEVLAQKQLVKCFSRSLSGLEPSDALDDPEKFTKSQRVFIKNIIGDSMAIKNSAFSMDDSFDIIYEVSNDETGSAIEVDTVLFSTFECK